MVHFSECSTDAAICKAETQIEMRDGTVENFPEVCSEAEAEFVVGVEGGDGAEQVLKVLAG